MAATFKIDLSEEKKKDDFKVTFALVIPEASYVSINNLINVKLREGNISYNLKAFFLEGLELLKNKYPLVNCEKALLRRFYRGGLQKEKIKSISTSVIITRDDINWIDNYILLKRLENSFFSKPDFVLDLVEIVRFKYQEKGIKI